MGSILYLVHRLPYPPNKGDKVRSYHLLKHLSHRHRVHLGTFVDDPDDLQHVDTVRAICADTHVVRLNPKMAKFHSLRGLVNDEPLTLPYYRDAKLQAWVDQTCTHGRIDAIVVFSAAMAQYVPANSSVPVLVDFVDVDSAKWSQYAGQHGWPMSWLYRREGRLLLAYERAVAQRATRSFFVTQNEADLFVRAAPECSATVGAISNGVDAEYFAPEHLFASPFSADEMAVVFTGAMDYWPNVDAVSWFVAQVLPALRLQFPQARFHIVGRAPSAVVLGLAGDAVVVTGTVADVRPYLRHAAVVVAPLRIARGIQNKVLEAMAMARPVVASIESAAAVDARPGDELLVARDAAEFVASVAALLAEPVRAASIGTAARQAVLARYSWEAHLAGIDCHIAAVGAPVAEQRVGAA